jgi:hypothetical protein
MIISFTALTITLIVLFILSIRYEQEAWAIILGLVTFFFLAFGWGLFLSTSTDRSVVTETDAKVVEMIKGKHITIVTSDKGEADYHVFLSYQSDLIDTSTHFKWVNTKNYNYYNFLIKDDSEFLPKFKNK